MHPLGLFFFKKEGNSDICYTHMILEDYTLSEIGPAQKAKDCMSLLARGT